LEIKVFEEVVVINIILESKNNMSFKGAILPQ